MGNFVNFVEHLYQCIAILSIPFEQHYVSNKLKLIHVEFKDVRMF